MTRAFSVECVVRLRFQRVQHGQGLRAGEAAYCQINGFTAVDLRGPALPMGAVELFSAGEQTAGDVFGGGGWGPGRTDGGDNFIVLNSTLSIYAS